ncbi:unnamed protein product [Citrullus colocynthis]|uniref:F-box domain-containing protein n=1 Tax=Citrullus colocynthis TaxID=252529 RepID=A0ABP0XU56_9ROSI
MADVPLDLIADIICRLPAKAILRFRRVSKIWKCLIDCSNFVNLHMKKSIDSRTHRHLIILKLIFGALVMAYCASVTLLKTSLSGIHPRGSTVYCRLCPRSVAGMVFFVSPLSLTDSGSILFMTTSNS